MNTGLNCVVFDCPCPQQAPAPTLEPKALVNEGQPLQPLEDVPRGQPVGTTQEMKENLAKFIESLHQKAASLTSWILALEPPTNPHPNERTKRRLNLLLLHDFL